MPRCSIGVNRNADAVLPLKTPDGVRAEVVRPDVQVEPRTWVAGRERRHQARRHADGRSGAHEVAWVIAAARRAVRESSGGSGGIVGNREGRGSQIVHRGAGPRESQARGWKPLGDHDRERGQEHQHRAHGVDRRLDAPPDHGVDQHGQRGGAGAGDEEGDDEVVERQREGEQRAGRAMPGASSGRVTRRKARDSSAPRISAASSRERVHAGEPRGTTTTTNEHVERDVRNDDGDEPERDLRERRTG